MHCRDVLLSCDQSVKFITTGPLGYCRGMSEDDDFEDDEDEFEEDLDDDVADEGDE
jgi:hypothetical protein